MYKYLGWLLIALLLAGSANGQSVGVGVGLDDVRGKAVALPPKFLTLVGTGFILLVGGGKIQCTGNC